VLGGCVERWDESDRGRCWGLNLINTRPHGVGLLDWQNECGSIKMDATTEGRVLWLLK
jgi:hypothetical protein